MNDFLLAQLVENRAELVSADHSDQLVQVESGNMRLGRNGSKVQSSTLEKKKKSLRFLYNCTFRQDHVS